MLIPNRQIQRHPPTVETGLFVDPPGLFQFFWTMAFKTCGYWFPTLELEKTVIWNLQDLHCWVKTFHFGFILRALVLLPIALLIPRPLGSFRSTPLPTGKGFECAEW